MGSPFNGRNAFYYRNPIILDLKDPVLIHRQFQPEYLPLCVLEDLKKLIDASIEFTKTHDMEAENKKLEIQYITECDKILAIKKQKKSREYIYLMRDNSLGLIKIGYSKFPKIREKTLQGEKPNIELIYSIEAPRKFEKVLHDYFIQYRVRGEWFKIEPEVVINYITKYYKPC